MMNVKLTEMNIHDDSAMICVKTRNLNCPTFEITKFLSQNITSLTLNVTDRIHTGLACWRSHWLGLSHDYCWLTHQSIAFHSVPSGLKNCEKLLITLKAPDCKEAESTSISFLG